MEVRPDYYDSFRCIADKCRHNCCIGWEIDIDDDALEKYQSTNGSLKEKLNKNIAFEPCAHFILSENERCPFLNSQNLCELIIAVGEDMLCQICRDHPRFYNDVYGITEKGVGISCEAAAKLILTKTSPFRLVSDSNIPNNEFFEYRKEIFGILQNRAKRLNDRIAELLAWADVTLPITDIDFIKVYKELERLDNSWDNYLDSIDTIKFDIPKEFEIPCEQLICYFIYRHLSGALEDFMFAERIQFAVLSCLIITNLSKNTEDMIEISRMYSCEIEYSDENINILLDILNEYNEK